MGIVDDILKALDRIPGWKRVQELPTEVDALKSRITALEEKLGDKWPADICKACGARALRMIDSFPLDKGIIQQTWSCGECKGQELRTRKPT